FFFQAEDGIRDWSVTGVQTCALPISTPWRSDPDAMAERIAAWWDARRVPGATVTEVTAPEGSGMSSETLLFTVEPKEGAAERYEIGRASCRERGEGSVGVG